jgi:hypothetical protein
MYVSDEMIKRWENNPLGKYLYNFSPNYFSIKMKGNNVEKVRKPPSV